eukprot:6026111-Pyramimonas_sp.AAC.1
MARAVAVTSAMPRSIRSLSSRSASVDASSAKTASLALSPSVALVRWYSESCGCAGVGSCAAH